MFSGDFHDHCFPFVAGKKQVMQKIPLLTGVWSDKNRIPEYSHDMFGLHFEDSRLGLGLGVVKVCRIRFGTSSRGDLVLWSTKTHRLLMRANALDSRTRLTILCDQLCIGWWMVAGTDRIAC